MVAAQSVLVLVVLLHVSPPERTGYRAREPGKVSSAAQCPPPFDMSL